MLNLLPHRDGSARPRRRHRARGGLRRCHRPATGIVDGRAAASWRCGIQPQPRSRLRMRARPTTSWAASLSMPRPRRAPRVPLVLFSHGLGGCGLQTPLPDRRAGASRYVVAAPDHADSATCGIGREDLRLRNMRTEQSFLDPKAWNDRANAAGCRICARRFGAWRRTRSWRRSPT